MYIILKKRRLNIIIVAVVIILDCHINICNVEVIYIVGVFFFFSILIYHFTYNMIWHSEIEDMDQIIYSSVKIHIMETFGILISLNMPIIISLCHCKIFIRRRKILKKCLRCVTPSYKCPFLPTVTVILQAFFFSTIHTKPLWFFLILCLYNWYTFKFIFFT